MAWLAQNPFQLPAATLYTQLAPQQLTGFVLVMSDIRLHVKGSESFPDCTKAAEA